MTCNLGFGFWATLFALSLGVLHGGTPSLLQVDLAAYYDGAAITIQLDPVFIVHGDDLRQPCGATIAAATFSDVIFWANWWPAILYEPLPPGMARCPIPPQVELEKQIMLHEYLHVRQYRALGPWSLIAQQVLPNWEGAPGTYSLQTMDKLNCSMYAPDNAMSYGYFCRFLLIKW